MSYVPVACLPPGGLGAKTVVTRRGCAGLTSSPEHSDRSYIGRNSLEGTPHQALTA